jgi:hypothetical protein
MCIHTFDAKKRVMFDELCVYDRNNGAMESHDRQRAKSQGPLGWLPCEPVRPRTAEFNRESLFACCRFDGLWSQLGRSVEQV